MVTANVNFIDAHHGTHQAKGQFMGFAWSGEFEYELKDNGFHSRIIQGPLDTMQGVVR